MQTISSELLAVAHSNHRVPQTTVTVDHQQVRGWVINQDESTPGNQFDVRLTNNGKIARARNQAGDLYLELATIGASPSFSTIVSGANALQLYSGVALFNEAGNDRLDVFYFDDSTPPNLRRRTSADNGTTWAAPTTIRTLIAQDSKVRNQLSVAGWNAADSYKPYIFYTSTPSGNPSLRTNLQFWDNSATNRCTLDELNLNVVNTKSPVTTLAAFQHPTNPNWFGCILFIDQPRGLSESGLYIIWYRDGLWSGAYPLYTFQKALDGNAEYTIKHPTLSYINGVYWLLATESTFVRGLSPNATPLKSSRLIAARSTDLIHWTKRDEFSVLAGTNSGMGYWTAYQADPYAAYNTAWTADGLKMAKLLVSGSRGFLINSGRLFQLNNGVTSLLSDDEAEYINELLDITENVTGWEVTLPNNPAGQGTVHVQNVTDTGSPEYNNDDILRRGSRVVIKGGYTANEDDTDQLTILTGKIDEVRQSTAIGQPTQNKIEVVVKDLALAKLEDWQSLVPFEYSSARHVYVPTMNDFGSVINVWGSGEGYGFELRESDGQILFPSFEDTAPEPHLGVLIANTGRVTDGIFDAKFKLINYTDNGTRFGLVFRYLDNKNFYFLVFNKTANKWDLLEYVEGVGTSMLTAPVNPADTIPAANEDWWVRVHLYHNTLVCSARKDPLPTDPATVHQWTKILDNSDFAASKRLKPRAGYWGFAGRSNKLNIGEVSNLTWEGGRYGVATTNADPIAFAFRFTVPAFPAGATTCQLTSYAVQLHVEGTPGGTVKFYLLDDDPAAPGGAGTAPVAIASRTAAFENADATKNATEIISGSWTTINVPTAVTLTVGSYYWIAFQPNPVITTDAEAEDNFYTFRVNWDGEEVNSVTDDFGTALTDWAEITGAVGGGAKIIFSVTLTGTGGAAALEGYILYSQEEPITLDYLTREIAASAGVLAVRPNYDVQELFDSSLSNWDTTNKKGSWTIVDGQLYAYNANSTYGFIRNTVTQFDEFLAEFDMTLGTTNGIAGGMLFALQNTNALTNDANLTMYEVEFNIGTASPVLIYALNGAAPAPDYKVFYAIPVITISGGKKYHVQVLHSGKFIQVWLNSILVAAYRTESILSRAAASPQLDETVLRPRGWVGLVSYHNDGANDVDHPAVKFDNFTITELKEIRDYFVIGSNRNAKQSLDDLLKYERIKYFGDYDGALRYGYFDNLTASGDLDYEETLVRATKTSTNRHWYSEVQPFGDYQAMRESGVLLDTDGLRYKMVDYTDARSDRGAYHQAAYPIRLAREMTDTYQFTAAANPALQREDRITIVNAQDGTNGEYIVDSITFRYTMQPPTFDMDVTCRKFVAASAENAAG